MATTKREKYKLDKTLKDSVSKMSVTSPQAIFLIIQLDHEIKKIFKENHKQIRFQQDGEEETHHCTPEVGRMVDVVLVSSTHVAGVDQVEDAKNNSGDGQYHVEIDLLQRGEKDKGKDNRRYSS